MKSAGIKLVTYCWKCNAETLQKEFLPVEIYEECDLAFVQSECMECKMHNKKIFSISEYEKKRTEYEKTISIPEPIH